jgi:aspartate aminotransferase
MGQDSWIRRMMDEAIKLRKQYKDEEIFDLTAGNPTVPPPPEFYRELRKLVENPVPGMHRYMQSNGYPETRAAVAEQLVKDSGLKFTANDVVMTCGSAAAANVVLKTIVNPGEEVIIFVPYFVEYPGYIENHGGVVKMLPCDDDFLPRLDALESGIGPQTRALILNSPNNPTGVVYGDSFLKQLAELLRKKEAQYGTEIFLISDEPYRKIIYDGLKFPFPSRYYSRSMIITSHSKDLSLPGERIGYIAISPECPNREELVAGFTFCNRTLGFVNAPALMQRVVARLQALTTSVADYQRKRDFLCDNLSKMGYSLKKPQGTFYLFPKSPVADEIPFVMELKDLKVLVVPGTGFGLPGYFRISYCMDDRVLEGSLDGFRKAIQKFKKGG